MGFVNDYWTFNLFPRGVTSVGSKKMYVVESQADEHKHYTVSVTPKASKLARDWINRHLFACTCADQLYHHSMLCKHIVYILVSKYVTL